MDSEGASLGNIAPQIRSSNSEGPVAPELGLGPGYLQEQLVSWPFNSFPFPGKWCTRGTTQFLPDSCHTLGTVTGVDHFHTSTSNIVWMKFRMFFVEQHTTGSSQLQIHWHHPEFRHFPLICWEVWDKLSEWGCKLNKPSKVLLQSSQSGLKTSVNFTFDHFEF